jgi:hypothetical protein
VKLKDLQTILPRTNQRYQLSEIDTETYQCADLVAEPCDLSGLKDFFNREVAYLFVQTRFDSLDAVIHITLHTLDHETKEASEQ